MTALRLPRITFALGIVLSAVAFAACENDDEIPVIRQETTQPLPDTIPGDEPLQNDIPELVTEHLEVEFGDRDWVDDVETIEESDGTVRVTLDRNFETDQQAFEELCTAVAGAVMPPTELGVQEVIVVGDKGEEVMRSHRGAPQCSPLAT
jgi:hypothetical protein